MKHLLTGNEAVARGAYEAGIAYASAYPGTPSTEILENVATYKKDIIAEWAPNEKVALETAIGASIAGARSLAAMKHVGVNVAADPLFTFAYTGVNGGMVLVTADDPGLHSSQNEQDNRNYAKFAKVAMLEPSDSQESKDMVKHAMTISEQFDVPVLLRMTTRINHGKSLVTFEERQEVGIKPYVKDLNKYDAVPAVARALHVKLEEKLLKLEAFANETELNFEEWNNSDIGIISAGVAYQYAKEAFGEKANYLKLGFTFPLPMNKIRAFAAKVKTLYVVEELDPYMEDQLKAAGIACIGKEKIPICGELNPDIIAEKLLGEKREIIEYNKELTVKRPPTLCAGCPHRGLFHDLGRRKKLMITGDIGCYALGGADPLKAKDTCICMGASISNGHGAQKVFDKFNVDMRAVAVIGDSTFFHTGINSLLGAIYNGAATVNIILDNRTTGMTGHQENPGTGYTLQGKPTKVTSIEEVCKALGVEHIRTINPNDAKEVKDALDWALDLDAPSVIVTRWPCILKKHSPEDHKEFGDYRGTCKVDREACIGCRMCLKTGCPALRLDKEAKKVSIDATQCVGCQVCAQVCPKDCIHRVEK